MKILGISGLEGAVPFKKRHWPGLEEREYRISQGHDSAAALVVDGRIVAAAAEERFSRRKHTAMFPDGAIGYCLAEAGIGIEDVDEIAHGFDYSPYKLLHSLDPLTARLHADVLSKSALVKQIHQRYPDFPEDRVHPVRHHLAHAASAHFTSGWPESLVVVLDAMGEAESVSVYHARENDLKPLHTLSASDSIGILYSLVTLHLGFDFNSDEYKIMGLAPYGNPETYRGFFESAVELHPDGSVRIPALSLNRSRDDRETYAATRKFLDEALIGRRTPESEITSEHCDVAAALQECLERTIIHLCSHFAGKTGLRRLSMAGGAALNCTANGRLMSLGVFDEIHVQPAAGDDGSALGAALFRAAEVDRVENVRMPVPFCGPASSLESIESALSHFSERIEVRRFAGLEETCAAAAELIADGRVLAWHRGRMEFGPRALGNRSILADPGHPEMRDRINCMVKKREAFRPFAPAVSLEQAHRYFDVPAGTELPYMIATVDVREEHRSLLPAITHVNGSARLQTVSAEGNPDFHALLRAVGKTTGREMVLNTSFNVKGQPIVNTPVEALETFLGTGIEFLFIENNLVARRGEMPSQQPAR
ncbi:MAG TPA: carbamoyltransferase C-terminal domain-containing protein [Bryobacteraceae bacterium]|nr:carbamoyltransferase C-terminal domain-containing protein [Bryobacteraceae bacterium]